VYNPIDGWVWDTLNDLDETITPAGDPLIGPRLEHYLIGVMEDPNGNLAYVYVTLLTDDRPWRDAELEAYLRFEFEENGTPITTPGNIPAVTTQNAVQGYDGIASTFDGGGVSILATSGSDMAALLDGFVDAQSGGMGG
jgi:hypothetical protein